MNDTRTQPPGRRPTLHDSGAPPRLALHVMGTLVIVGLTTLGAGGCAGSSGAPGSTTPTMPPPPVTTTTIDPAVVSAFMQPRITAIPVGTYRNAATPHGAVTLVIGEIGASYTEFDSGGQRFQGTLSEDPANHHVTFTNAAGAPCAHQPGVYQVSLDGKVLHLQPIADPCPSRAADFPSGPWTS